MESVERPHAASDVVSAERPERAARASARLVTCDVPETRPAAAAGGGRRALRLRRPAARPGASPGRGPRRRGLCAGRLTGAAAGGGPRLPLPRPRRPG